ncbi:MAG: hypothetical protein P9L88_02740 [Candidatus Tantalella remota]|nr:hypothetical protein [Candidatus Tantalella remota]
MSKVIMRTDSVRVEAEFNCGQTAVAIIKGLDRLSSIKPGGNITVTSG